MQPLDQYPELAAAAAALPREARRAVARRLSMLSVFRTGEEGMGTASVEALRQRVDELDSAAFDLRDRADKGEPALMDAYVEMFRRARAVDSRLALQLDDVDRSIYESLHALGTDETLVLEELRGADTSRP